jgi:hypothetical protein
MTNPDRRAAFQLILATPLALAAAGLVGGRVEFL